MTTLNVQNKIKKQTDRQRVTVFMTYVLCIYVPIECRLWLGGGRGGGGQTKVNSIGSVFDSIYVK